MTRYQIPEGGAPHGENLGAAAAWFLMGQIGEERYSVGVFWLLR